MENVIDQSRRQRILEALEVDGALARNLSTKNKAFGTISRNAIITRRLHVLHEWQTSRRELISKVFGLVEEIEMLENKLPQNRMEPTEPAASNSNASSSSSSTSEEKQNSMPDYIRNLLNMTDGEMVMLGPNGTQIRRDVLAVMNWSLSNANITRKILMELFDRSTLATHTLSGKPSPAFVGCNKPTKMQLDPQIVQDITHVLTNSLDMTEKEVRQAITTKCADENKMYRQRQERRESIVKRRRKSELEDNEVLC